MDQAIEVPSKVQPGEFIVATRYEERGPRVVVGEVKQVKVGTDGVESVMVDPVIMARNISGVKCQYSAEALFDTGLWEVEPERVLPDGYAAQVCSLAEELDQLVQTLSEQTCEIGTEQFHKDCSDQDEIHSEEEE